MLTKLVAIISLYKLGKTQEKKSSNPCGNKADLYLPIKKERALSMSKGISTLWSHSIQGFEMGQDLGLRNDEKL